MNRSISKLFPVAPALLLLAPALLLLASPRIVAQQNCAALKTLAVPGAVIQSADLVPAAVGSGSPGPGLQAAPPPPADSAR